MAAEPLMDRGAMKRLLVRSKEDAVSCAVGMGKDAQMGLLLLDKIKQPKALEREIMKQPDIRNPRFGKALVDVETDPKLVKFYLNRAAPGIARRLVKTLKGTGFTKVEIVMDDETVVESHAESESEDETKPHAAGEPGVTQPEEAPAPQITAPDPAALKQALAELLGKVKAFQGDAALRVELITLAQAANTALKAEDLDGATKSIEALRSKLGGSAQTQQQSPEPKPTTPDPKPGQIVLSPVRVGKAALLWRGMWAKADRDLQTLHDVVIETMYEDQDVDPDSYDVISANIARVSKLTTRLNLKLADEIDGLINANPASLSAPLAQLKKRLDKYEQLLQSDEFVGLLADNEFHPVPVKDDLMKAVGAIRSAITVA